MHAILVASAPLADMIWPALVVEHRLFSWWAIALGLLVEFPFVWRLTNLGFARSLFANLTMNAMSALFGIVLIPLSGCIWEIFPGLFMGLLGIGTFNPITWTATFCMAVAINAWIERSSYDQSRPDRHRHGGSRCGPRHHAARLL